MCKYISFGKINWNYKYILLYTIFQLINQFLFSKEILPKIGTFNRTLIANHKIIMEIFIYIGIFLISIFLYIYEIYQKKRKGDKDKNDLIKRNNSNSKMKLIYKDQLSGKVSMIKILFILFLLVLEAQLMNIFYCCGLDGLDFWMFEILFIYYISSKMLRSPMYKHQKCSVFFILIFCCLMKATSTSLMYFDEEPKIYKTYKLLIIIGIILFILISYLRAYVTCKIKWLIDLKYISSSKLLMLYGLIGTVFCSIACIFTTFFHCQDTIISYKEMKNICRLNQTIFLLNGNKTENISNYHFDSYKIYYQKLLDGDNFYIFKNICLILSKTLVCFFVKLFSMLIIKYLNPAYFICSSSFYYFLLRLLRIIVSFIKKEDVENNEYLDFFIEIFSILGILVYTELIELNFCELDYNLKKNIIKRSMKEGNNAELISCEDEIKSDINNDTIINSEANEDE